MVGSADVPAGDVELALEKLSFYMDNAKWRIILQMFLQKRGNT